MCAGPKALVHCCACLLMAVFFLLCAAGSSAFAQQDTLVIKLRPFREKNIDYTKEYKIQLLDLILSKTEPTDGPFRIELAGSNPIPQSRVIEMVDEGNITIIAAMTSTEREQLLLPVRLPIFKGLMGVRIFIIKRTALNKFAIITSAGQLKRLWAGQGHDWPDTTILMSNGYNITTSSNYKGLFSMLETGRFDYFPRSVLEPWREIEAEKDRDLIVEPSLAIQYYAPAYYFVSRKNPKLAERIQRGFEMAIADGSFDKLFNTHWYIQGPLKQAKMHDRTIFYLHNPLLSKETPLNRSELWYTPYKH